MTVPQDPLAWAIKAFRDGQNERYETYQQYLAGNQPLAFATDKFVSAFGRLFREFAYNRCEMVVDAHADRLQVAGFAAKTDAIAQRAQDIWDANLMDVNEGHVYTEAFGAGDAHVYCGLHPGGKGVHVWVQQAANVRVHFDEDVPGEIDLAAKYWLAEDGRGRLNIYFAGRIEKYVTRNKAPSGIPTSTGGFQPFEIVGEDWPMPLNVLDRVPVFHFANNGLTNAYGVSELRNVVPLQDAINKTLMDMLIAMEFAAFPQRVIINVDDSEAETQESIKRFQTGIDRILTLYGVSDGKQPSIAEFSAANIAQYLAVAEFWDKAVSRVTKVPVHYLSLTGDFPSGRALRIAEGPFLSKLEDRQRAFGNVWSSVMEYAVRLSGMDVESGTLRVNWKSAAPLSEEDQLDRALQRDMIGIPFESNLKMLGYEPGQIEEILALKDAAVKEAQRVFDRGAVPAGFNEEEESAA